MRKVLVFIVLCWSATLFAEDTIPAIDALAADSLAADTLAVDTLAVDTLAADSVQQLTIFDVMPNVVLHQDSLVRQLVMDKVFGRELQDVEVAGFRVQIYSSNHQQMAKQEAIRLEKEMQDKLDVPVYVSYMPPFWKVRIGDFATYEDAQEFKNGFIQQFPELMGDTYVVRDQVILKR